MKESFKEEIPLPLLPSFELNELIILLSELLTWSFSSLRTEGRRGG